MEIQTVKINGEGYLVNGVISVPVAEGNRHYKAVQEWLDAGNTPEQEFTPQELQAQLISHFTSMTDIHIQNAVTAYNTANGTAFANVHNCESYSRMTGYTHQPFCQAVWEWSVQVWETVRQYQATVTTPPTDAEFQAVLDGVVLTY